MSQQPTMMNCPDCAKEISLSAKACPHCGCSELASTQKSARLEQAFAANPKAGVLSIVIVIALFIVGAVTCRSCGNWWVDSVEKSRGK